MVGRRIDRFNLFLSNNKVEQMCASACVSVCVCVCRTAEHK